MILFIDDDVVRMESHVDFFEASGHEVDWAKSTSEAFQRLHLYGNDLSLVILDIMMPTEGEVDEEAAKGGYRTGVEILKEISQELPGVPVVIFSAVSEDNLGYDWRELGAKAYLEKAKSPADLYETAIKYLKQPKEA